VVGISALCGVYADGHAATRTWTGGSSTLWSAASNWGGVAPSTGDDLVFPEGAGNTSNTNDFAAGTAFRSITVNGSYTILGNRVTLTGADALTLRSTTVASATFAAPVTVTNVAATIATTQVDGLALDATIGPITIAGGALSLSIAGSLATVNFSGTIDETTTATITKSGNGIAVLNADNAYTGATTVNHGYLGVGANLGLGAGSNSPIDGTVVNAGGTLFLAGTSNIANERIELNGAGQSGNGAFQTQSGSGATRWGGDVVLNTANIAMNLLGASLTIAGRITGPGDFQFGRSVVTISNPLNDYAGTTVIGNPAGGTTVLKVGADDVIPNGSPVSILAGGTLDLDNRLEVIASVSGVGVVDKIGSLILAGNASTTFDGIFVGNGGVTKTGTGTLTLNGFSNTSFLTFNLNAGTTVVNGTIGANVLVGGSGTLAGTGSAGFVATFAGSAATIAPGAVALPGLFSVLSLQLVAGNTLALQLNGLTAGTQYDQLATAYGLTLVGCTLSVTLGFAPPAGSVFRIIDNKSPSQVGGTFAGLPEGAVLPAGGTRLRIAYTGGDGNDVTLTVLPTITITPSSLAGGMVGVGYSAVLSATGGTPPYVWSISGGALPPGLALNPATGAISGSPTMAGAFNFTVTASDNDLGLGSVPLSIVVAPAAATQPIPALGPAALGLLAFLMATLGFGATRSRR
jgi:autotransporter-associated beta strand protein